MQKEDEEELHFDLINATFSPNKGVVCHIVASWNVDNISGAKKMLKNIDDIEVFECSSLDKEHEDHDEHDENDHEEDGMIKQLTDEEKEEYIKQLNGIDIDEIKGGEIKKNPPLITTSNLVNYLSKSVAK